MKPITMKKVLLILFVFSCSCCCFAQQVLRLNQDEIKANGTPEAVAYNFVRSVIHEDYAQTVELMSLDLFFNTVLLEKKPPEVLFSSEYTHDIVDMRPVVKMGYEVVITDIQPLDPAGFFDEDSKYYNEPLFGVWFDCADANDQFYDGSKGQFDTDTKVLVVKEGDSWKVLGFK